MKIFSPVCKLTKREIGVLLSLINHPDFIVVPEDEVFYDVSSEENDAKVSTEDSANAEVKSCNLHSTMMKISKSSFFEDSDISDSSEVSDCDLSEIVKGANLVSKLLERDLDDRVLSNYISSSPKNGGNFKPPDVVISDQSSVENDVNKFHLVSKLYDDLSDPDDLPDQVFDAIGSSSKNDSNLTEKLKTPIMAEKVLKGANLASKLLEDLDHHPNNDESNLSDNLKPSNVSKVVIYDKSSVENASKDFRSMGKATNNDALNEQKKKKPKKGFLKFLSACCCRKGEKEE